MAAMVPHSRSPNKQQSANILGDCRVRRHWEWGTMAIVVGHLGHGVSTDVVGLLLVVSYIGKRRVVYQIIGDASPMR